MNSISMKKLNIFGPNRKSKALNDSGGTCSGGRPPTPTGDTLNRLVNAKEEAKRRWEEEREQFDRRRREHEVQLIEIERQEVQRREEEIRRRNEELDEKRRQHRILQDAFVQQIAKLNDNLEEYKVQHKKEEEDMEDEIMVMEDHLSEVKNDLVKRTKQLGIAEEKERPAAEGLGPPSAPSAPCVSSADCPDGSSNDDMDSHYGGSASYPTLPSYSDISLDNVDAQPGIHKQPLPAPRVASVLGSLRAPTGLSVMARPIYGASIGSSPLSSHGESSRSGTPRTDQSDVDSSV